MNYQNIITTEPSKRGATWRELSLREISFTQRREGAKLISRAQKKAAMAAAFFPEEPSPG